ncbi:MAG: bifunctional (p)ppGpp synthetase/guanosine-3',5'-bis(diphosphate) 3'-pyrophosphohydrolase [Eubacteriales bacterium]|nr:bifunctional (p)ppGpp synthetase/guanosine-3',5'-bis(diphosphate) 3'-pyrophosphohydrolase [Eubacteriales bacterium]
MTIVEELYSTLKERIAAYNPDANFDIIDQAYKFALNAHEGQLRISGEPYITHPLNVALVLTDMELDDDSICATILHDVVEDTEYTYNDLKELFGVEVANLVEGVTKLGKIPYSTKEEQQAENIRKLILAMSKDIRVMLIKLADRLHNMRSLKSMPEEKQRRIACETLEIYAPIAHRLGISKIKWELEDLSLRYLDPIAYKEISDMVDEKRDERVQLIDEIKGVFSEKLAALGINGHIEGRAKHFYSIYRKMFTHNVTNIEQIYDLTAIRIIVESINDCYAALGMVHEIYIPMPGRFKDYIAMPKNNMYQSLHTTLIGPNGKPFEVQIRTWEMHRLAEVGIAAHWKYKEGRLGKSEMDTKLEWIRQLLDVHTDNDNPQEFISSIKVDLFEDEVFVFSPKGDVVNLPNGATSIDFAYAIHSAIGNKMTGAKINGRITQLEYKLKNGDIVEIITSSNVRGPSKDWLKIVKTNQAKKKINDWFKKEHREENIALGKEIFEKELKRMGLSHEELAKLEWTTALFKKYYIHSMEDLYSAIGYGTLPVAKVISRIKNEYNKTIIDQKIVMPIGQKTVTTSISHGVVVKDIDNCLVKLARCCNPLLGDDIVGYITRGRGVSVHRADCPNVRRHNDPTSPEYPRYIDVWWAESSTDKYITDIQIISNSRAALVYDITGVIADLKISLMAINARELKDGLSVVNITVEVNSKEHMDYMIKKIRTLEGVASVSRATH